MTKLDRFTQGSQQLDLGVILAEIEAEEQGHHSLHLTPSNGGALSSPWMWYDKDPSLSIEEKVRQAAERYRARFGRLPNMCYVNHKAISGDGFALEKIAVKPASNILPHHFWLGVKP